MMKIVCTIFLSALFVTDVFAQSSPGLIQGQVPTAAQWNSYFAAKQDLLAYPPVFTTGSTLIGPLITAASTTTAAGFNIASGVAPSNPNNGDMWVTGSGLFVHVGGSTLTIGGTQFVQVMIQPAPSSVSQGLLVSQSEAGTTNSGSAYIPGNNSLGWNQINVTSDSVARPTSGINKTSALLISHDYGGSTLTAGRNTLDVYSVLTARSSVSNPDHNWQASNFEWYSNINEGGSGTTLGTAQGSGFSIGGAAQLDNGATDWLNLSFIEANVSVITGSSVAVKSLIQLANLSTDSVQGSVVDTMIWFQGQSSSPMWKNGLAFGYPGLSTGWPLTSSGCFICSLGTGTAATGVDFSTGTISGNFLNFASPTTTMQANSAGVIITSSTSTDPGFSLVNSTNDANAANVNLIKTRSGGNTNSSDNLGIVLADGFANSAVRAAAEILFVQAAASSGSNIPSKIELITSSSGGALNQTLQFDQNGHLSNVQSAAPTLTAGCNSTGSSITGSDLDGQVNGQTAAATSCTVTFGATFGSAPNCTVSGQTTPVTSYTPGTSTLVINFSSTASAKFNWQCIGA